jgi:hypothetical protein
MTVTILLAAGDIQECTKVRKPNGSKQYTLRTDLKLYGEGAKVVKTDANVRFLVSEDGSINLVPPDMVLALDMSLDESIEYLEEIRNRDYVGK